MVRTNLAGVFGTIFFVLAVSAKEKLKITTIVEKPYVIDNGNGDFEGLIPDMLDRMKEKLDIDYELTKVADGVYGQKQSNGQWNGMIGEIQSGRASVAAAPITVSKEREQVVDFTEPFMSVETTLLALKPKDGEKLPFTDAASLAAQTDIKYGVVKDGMTQKFFKTSQNPTYKKMWEAMEQDSSSFVDSNNAGVEKVRSSDGKFVFIIESSTADYYINNSPCNLQKIDKVDESTSHYAFAVKKNSGELLANINKAIQEMKASNEIDELRNKWWKGDCSSSAPAIVSSLALSALALLFARFI